MSENRTERVYLVRCAGELILPAGAVVRALPEAAVDTLDALAKGLSQIPAATPVADAVASDKTALFLKLAVRYVQARNGHSGEMAAAFRELQKAYEALPLLIRRPNDPIVGSLFQN